MTNSLRPLGLVAKPSALIAEHHFFAPSPVMMVISVTTTIILIILLSLLLLIKTKFEGSRPESLLYIKLEIHHSGREPSKYNDSNNNDDGDDDDDDKIKN